VPRRARRAPHGGCTGARTAPAQAGGARRGGEMMTPRTAPAGADATVTTLPPDVTPPPLSLRQLTALHGGLLVTNVIWSFMHVIMCAAVQQTRGARAPLVRAVCKCLKGQHR
jgi:hypothetical protein